MEKKLTEDELETARKMLVEGPYSIDDVAKNVGVSISTLRRTLPKECQAATDRNLNALKAANEKGRR
jgi:transposase